MASAGKPRGALAPLEGSVVVDLSKVSFLDSSAIGILVEVRIRLPGEVAACGCARRTMSRERVLELTGLSDWIED
jgi:anti-anti-sigma factor